MKAKIGGHFLWSHSLVEVAQQAGRSRTPLRCPHSPALTRSPAFLCSRSYFLANAAISLLTQLFPINSTSYSLLVLIPRAIRACHSRTNTPSILPAQSPLFPQLALPTPLPSRIPSPSLPSSLQSIVPVSSSLLHVSPFPPLFIPPLPVSLHSFLAPPSSPFTRDSTQICRVASRVSPSSLIQACSHICRCPAATTAVSRVPSSPSLEGA